MMRHIQFVMIFAVLGACSADGPDLVQLRSNDSGPEEFSIDVMKPLQEPQDYAALPTPGGVNRADLTPRRDAIAALGGAENVTISAENALTRYAARFGPTPEIRTLLAQEDEKTRKNAALIRRFQILERDKYAKHYARFALNAKAEAEYWRKRGVTVPQPTPAEN